QQRLRLAVHQLVLSPLPRGQSVRLQLHEPRLPLQGPAKGHVRQLQAPPQNPPHAPPRRRRQRQRRGFTPNERHGPQDQLRMTPERSRKARLRMKPVAISCEETLSFRPEEIAEQILDVSNWPQLTGFAFIPGIKTAQFEVRTPEIVGSRIRVTNTDGSS